MGTSKKTPHRHRQGTARLVRTLKQLPEIAVACAIVQLAVHTDGCPICLVSRQHNACRLLNLNLGVKLANGWEVQAWGSNLADKDYLIDAGNTGQQLGLPTYIVGAPRMFGVRVAYQFGNK